MVDNRIRLAEKIFFESIESDYEKALDMCSDVLSASANKVEIYLAHEVRCSILSSIGSIVEAIHEASMMIDVERSQPHPWFKRARLFLRIGRNEEAISDLTKVLEFNEDYFRETSLLMRSFAYLEINKECSRRDAMLLDDDFSFSIRTARFGYKEFSKADLLKMAGD
jgi:tetratricopeptide (TPR) repeat protein